MRRRRSALELGMELAADEVRVLLQLDHLDELLVGARAREHEARLLERLAVVVGELVAMAMALADLRRLIGVGRDRSGEERAREAAETHRRALAPNAALLGHEIDHGVRRVAIELGRVRVLECSNGAGKLDDSELHAETDPEERELVH